MCKRPGRHLHWAMPRCAAAQAAPPTFTPRLPPRVVETSRHRTCGTSAKTPSRSMAFQRKLCFFYGAPDVVFSLRVNARMAIISCVANRVSPREQRKRFRLLNIECPSTTPEGDIPPLWSCNHPFHELSNVATAFCRNALPDSRGVALLSETYQNRKKARHES